MRAACLITALVALMTLAASANGQCRVRKELRTLSSSERQVMVRAIKAMRQNGSFARLQQEHTDNLAYAHGNFRFMLWHRAFTMRFEDAFMAAAGGGISGLPFLDLSRDAPNPAGSPVWGEDLMGPVGGCLGAPFAEFTNGGKCVYRGVPSASWGGCAATVVAAAIRTIGEYTEFTQRLESTCHNSVHSSFGDSSALYWVPQAPSDPFFYPFHAGIDYNLAMWQTSNSRADLDLNDKAYFGKSAAQLFAYNEGPGCYTYDRSSPPKPQPDPTSSASTSTSTTTTATTGTATTSGTAAPTPTNDGKGAGNSTTPETWIPEFSELSPKFFSDNMPWMSAEQITGFNRAYKYIIEYLKRLQSSGKSLPMLGDFRSIVGQVKSPMTSGNTPAAAGSAQADKAAGSGAAAATAVSLGVSALLALFLLVSM
ncbi:hypothetical protein BC828DRAFT_372293 [Blastocladiella britannica]|nr:hypothetical protein BC828DRAFT_372293 [Blastocladiella britannica]